MTAPVLGALVVGAGGYAVIGGVAILAAVATFFLLAIVGLVRAG